MNPSGAGRRHRCGASLSPQIRRRNLLLGDGGLQLPAFARARRIPEADAVALGADFAGFAAARRLREAGEQTILLEGGERTGGRVRPLARVPGMEGAPASGLRAADQALQALRGD